MELLQKPQIIGIFATILEMGSLELEFGFK